MGEPFKLPGEVLFRLSFSVHHSSAADFNEFIEQVERELRSRIQCPRFFGSSMTTMLPREPRSPDRRRWFVIDLQSRDRETNHSLPLFIEAETIYIRGYQNEHGEVFEFKQNDGKSYLTSSKKKGGSRKPTQLSFSCNYKSIVDSTPQKGRGGSLLDSGVTLEAAGYGARDLRQAVVDLAEGRNLPGESQHMTARNLLRVVVRFSESIRFRSVRREMVNLWSNSTGGGGGSLSPHCVGQINNWSCIGRNLVDSHRYADFVWSRYLQDKAGVGSVAAAQEVLALVKFHIRQDEDVDEKKGEVPDPDKNNPPRWKGDDDDDRRGGHGGGAWGGVVADDDEVVPPLQVPEEPVMEILSVVVCTPRHGIYGRITVTDGFGDQTIYQRTRDDYQKASDDDSGDVQQQQQQMMLELDVPKRPIPAYDCVDIDVDLYDASTQAPLAAGHMSWNSCDLEANTNRYDVPTRWNIGDGVALEYIVYSKAVQVAVGVTVDNYTFGGALDAPRGHWWFSTRNTMIGPEDPRRLPMNAGFGSHVAAVPIGFKLQVTVGFEHEPSPWPVPLLRRTFELEPSEEGGTSTKTDKLQDGSTTAKVDFAWSLLRKEPPGPTTSTQDPNENAKHEHDKTMM